MVVRSETLRGEPTTWRIPGSSQVTLDQVLAGPPGSTGTATLPSLDTFAWLIRDARSREDDLPSRLEAAADQSDLSACHPSGGRLELAVDLYSGSSPGLASIDVNLRTPSVLFFGNGEAVTDGPVSGTVKSEGRWLGYDVGCSLDLADTIEVEWRFNQDVNAFRETACGY